MTLATDHPTSSLTSHVEVRALDGGSCLVTVGETHHIVRTTAADVLHLLDGWRGRTEVAPALREAGDGLRRLVESLGGLIPATDAPSDAAAPGPALTSPTDADESGVRAGDLLLAGRAEAASLTSALAAATGGRAVALDPRAVVNRAYRTGELLVVVVRGPHDDDLVDLDRTCHDMRVRWLPVEVTRSRASVGPLVTPGRGAGFEDLVARRAAAAHDRRAHRALRRPALTGDRRAPGADEAAVTAAVGRLLEEARSGGLLDTLVEVAADGTTSRHPVLPTASAATVHRAHEPSDLLDPLTGLVLRTRDIRHDDSVPASLVTRQCDVADVRAVSRWANNVLCQGSAFTDADAADRAALGESVERYCANILDTLPVVHASHDELRRSGREAVDPAELVLYSPAQYAAPGFPFVPLHRDTRVHWVPGRSLTRDVEVLVPASLVYVNWYSAGFAQAPPTNFCAFAGIAAGPDLDFAVMSGLEEVVERHATMVWWLNGHPLPAVSPTPELSALWAGTDPARQRASLIALDHDLGVPVAAGVVHDDVERLVNVGFSARPTFAAAAAKAWTEALTLQEGSRDLLRMDGLHWAVMARGELNGRAFKPWRADRAYLEDFRPDMRDCDDLMVQQQVFLDPRARERMAHLLEPAPRRTVAQVDARCALPARTLADYRERVERAGHEVVVVDLTTPDVASAGMAVVRVLVPGTVGNAPAAFPFLGRRRVQDLAVALGWRETALEEPDLNYFPLPHA